MTRNLLLAMQDIAKAEGLAYAIEETYMDIQAVKEDAEKLANAVNAVYALTETIHRVAEDLDNLEVELISGKLNLEI